MEKKTLTRGEDCWTRGALVAEEEELEGEEALGRGRRRRKRRRKKKVWLAEEILKQKGFFI